MAFTADEDAYNRLDEYLKRVREHFATYKEANEIVGDIEARFAEQFMQKREKGAVINLSDVEGVIASMGTPEQFDDEAQPKTHAQPQVEQVRRLYRDPDNVVIAGVASGLAAYLGVDPVWIRIIFFISVFLGGTGVLIYVLLWIFVPEAKNETEKLRMRGKPVTIENIKQTVHDRAEELKEHKGKFYEILQMFGKVIRAFVLILVKLIKLAVKIGGAFLSILGVGIAAVAFFTATTLLFNANAAYVDIPLAAISHSGWYYAAVISTLVSVVLPLLALIILGISMASGKSYFRKVAGFSLFGVWIIALAVAINSGIKLAPQIQQAVQTSPEYQTSTRQLDLKDFTKVEVSGADTMTIQQGSTYAVTVEGRERDLDQLNVSVVDGELTYNRIGDNQPCFFCRTHAVHFIVTVPTIESIGASGASKVMSDGIKTDVLSLDLSGASRAILSVTANAVNGELSGASEAILSGTVSHMDLKETGGSRVIANDLHFTVNPLLSSIPLSLKADLSGASRLSLTGEMSGLDVSLSGASRIDGESVNAKDVKAHLSGASKMYLGNILTLSGSTSGASSVQYESAVKDDLKDNN